MAKLQEIDNARGLGLAPHLEKLCEDLGKLGHEEEKEEFTSRQDKPITRNEVFFIVLMFFLWWAFAPIAIEAREASIEKREERKISERGS